MQVNNLVDVASALQSPFSISVHVAADTIIMYQTGFGLPGTSGRRLREGLLDNVDPAAPADPLEAGWRPLATPVADEPAPSTPTNGSSAAAGDEDSAWRAASQYGASTSGTAGPAAGAADTDNRSSSSSNSSSNGSGAADDDTGWGASLGPVPEDWGWAPSSRNGNGHHHGSTWAGLAGAVGSSTPRDDGSSEAVPGSSSGAWPPDAEDVAGELGSEEGVPDIVELRPQELVRHVPACAMPVLLPSAYMQTCIKVHAPCLSCSLAHACIHALKFICQIAFKEQLTSKGHGRKTTVHACMQTCRSGMGVCWATGFDS